MRVKAAAVFLAISAIAGPAAAQRAPADGGAAGEPEVNPFECYGRWEAATGNRTMGQMRIELLKKLDLLDEDGASAAPAAARSKPADPAAVQAMRLCVVAMLKQRLGDDDASRWFAAAVQANPDEPGYELFWGMYWGGTRGAKLTPVRDLAELHFRRALEKIGRLRVQGRFRVYHAVVEDWTQKRLLVLHQQDGVALVPWSAFPYRPASEWVPQVWASVQVVASADTRDFYYNSETRTFTGEEAFAESDVRAARRLTPRERWDLARAPWRYEVNVRARLGLNPAGDFDVFYDGFRSPNSQITSFYAPTAIHNDVIVEQVGAGYERVLPLYPLFDLRVAGSYRRVRRQGLIEFLPDRKDEFNMYELRPSISRLLGADKLTLNGVYAFLDIQPLPGGVPEQAMRQKVIRAAEVVYGLYRTLSLPDGFSLHAYRTPTRGWYLYAGAAQDDEIYGIRKVTRNDYYAGTRFSAARPWQVQLQGTYYTSRTTFVDPNDPSLREFTDPTQTFSSFSPSLSFQLGLVDPDAAPGLQPAHAGFRLDMLNLVVPVKWEVSALGRNDFENARGGVEVWAKLFQDVLWGAPLLSSIGYEAQYFYRLDKVMNLVHASLRVGWGDL